MVGDDGSSAGSYLAAPTSPIPSHRAVITLLKVSSASIVVTSTLRVKISKQWYNTWLVQYNGNRTYRSIQRECEFSTVLIINLMPWKTKHNLQMYIFIPKLFMMTKPKVAKRNATAKNLLESDLYLSYHKACSQRNVNMKIPWVLKVRSIMKSLWRLKAQEREAKY